MGGADMNAIIAPAAASRPPGIPSTHDGKSLRYVWGYRDADGVVLGYVARFDAAEGKDIVPFFKRDGTRWKAGAPPERRPLFGLDSLEGAEAFVAEGEKCVAAMHSLGFPCVSSLGGAQSPHKSDWTPLNGFKRVYLLPDNDAAGETYAQAVAGVLGRFSNPPDVFIARLPDLPDGGDLADWLQTRTVTQWDGFQSVPREAGDDLSAELLEVIRDRAVQVPPEWLRPEGGTAEPETDGDAWEAPVPLDAAVVPPWPTDVFPEPVQRFVNALAESTETPPELPAMMVQSVLATGCQGKYRVRIKNDYFEPTNLWTCCTLPSGSRKTAVLTKATAPLVEWERRERARIEPEVKRAESEAKTLQGRADTLRRNAAKEKGPMKLDILTQEVADLEARIPVVPSLPQLWTSDVTPENLATIMDDNDERMALLSDEGGIFETMAGRYSKGTPNLDVYLQGHAGSPVRVNRGSRPSVLLECPTLTIGLTPQPDVVRTLTDKPGFRGRGLLGRFLYVMPKSNLGQRTGETDPVPDTVKNDYHGIVTAMLDLPWNVNDKGERCAYVLRLSQEAFASWRKFSQAVEVAMAPGGTFAHMTDWAGKFPGAMTRIAAVLHVARHALEEPWQHDIAQADMDAALRMGKALAQHALIAFDAMGADSALDSARILFAWIRREKLATFTRRDAHAAHKSRFRRAEELDDPLNVLAERHYIQLRRKPVSPGPGRPSTVYDVNPAALLLADDAIKAAARGKHTNGRNMSGP